MWRTSPPNWERFDHYARRIRLLSHYDQLSYVLSRFPRVIRGVELSIEFPERSGINSLLPNIQEITWSMACDIANLPLVLPFISRSLKALTLNLTAGKSEAGVDIVCHFFDTLIAFAGLELETFKFASHPLEVKDATQLLSFLKSQRNIKVLEVSSDPYVEPTPVQDILFPNFPQSLHELSVNVEFEGQSDYNDRIQTILQRLPNLRVLELVLTSNGSWNLSNFEGLAPLLQNPDLEELSLWVAEDINLNHTDIHTLGRALPKITSLNLRLFYTGLPAVGMPASSLMDFAKAFSNLETLYLQITEIDVSLPLPSPGNEGRVCPFNPATFRSLHVGNSLLSQKDVPCMAEFLRMLCRHPLFDLEHDGEDKAWENVKTGMGQKNSAPVNPRCEQSE
ncbi:hypothetical protein FRC00_011677 [Tulasnella sp. 408]|nr:hypothetical protein FRC00_011677 [Tulasnella sp. 408]